VAAMPCPICKTGLTLSERSGVEIDYCPTCRGVWLDRGELDKIIERTVADLSSARPAAESHRTHQRSDAYRDDDHRPYGKRKKSFLSELFD